MTPEPKETEAAEEAREAAARVKWAGVPVVEQRRLLRDAQRECPACTTDAGDDLEDQEIPGWLESHGVELPSARTSRHE